MKVSEVKTCIRHLAKNVIKFKQEDSNPILQRATTALQATETDGDISEEEANDIAEFFDMVSDEWFTASNNIDEVTEILFNQFISLENDKAKLKYKKLFKALDSLPTAEDKHLLILAIKYYGLLNQGLFKMRINKSIDEESITLVDLSHSVPRSIISPKVSASSHMKGKEELTMDKMYEISTSLKQRLRD